MAVIVAVDVAVSAPVIVAVHVNGNAPVGVIDSRPSTGFVWSWPFYSPAAAALTRGAGSFAGCRVPWARARRPQVAKRIWFGATVW